MTEFSVQIAPSGEICPTIPAYEVRVVGPGGWRTAYRGTLSGARHEAYAWTTVLRCPLEDLSPDGLRCDADGRADYEREKGR